MMSMTFESAKEEARIIRNILEYIESNIGGKICGANSLKFELKCGCCYYISINHDNIECYIKDEYSKCLNVIRHIIGYADRYDLTENLADPNCFSRLRETIKEFSVTYDSEWSTLLDIQKQSLTERPYDKLPHGYPDLECGG